jgi:hypothetical protein
VKSRAALGFPLLRPDDGARAKAAFDAALEDGVNAGALAAARAVAPASNDEVRSAG